MLLQIRGGRERSQRLVSDLRPRPSTPRRQEIGWQQGLPSKVAANLWQTHPLLPQNKPEYTLTVGEHGGNHTLDLWSFFLKHFSYNKDISSHKQQDNIFFTDLKCLLSGNTPALLSWFHQMKHQVSLRVFMSQVLHKKLSDGGDGEMRNRVKGQVQESKQQVPLECSTEHQQNVCTHGAPDRDVWEAVVVAFPYYSSLAVREQQMQFACKYPTPPHPPFLSLSLSLSRSPSLPVM